MSGKACAGNADCEDQEKCGAFQIKDADTVNLCVAWNYCGSLGRINNVSWGMPCWADVEAGATAVKPDDVDTDAWLTAMGEVLDLGDAAEKEQLWISGRYQHQDGWWYLDANEKYQEVDKAIDNRCELDMQCNIGDPDALKCCASWPSTNNKRCILKTDHNTSVTKGPLTFTQACASLIDSEPVPDVSGEDDVGEDALTKASEEIDAWFD